VPGEIFGASVCFVQKPRNELLYRYTVSPDEALKHLGGLFPQQPVQHGEFVVHVPAPEKAASGLRFGAKPQLKEPGTKSETWLLGTQ
jgi:hypothetical protein